MFGKNKKSVVLFAIAVSMLLALSVFSFGCTSDSGTNADAADISVTITVDASDYCDEDMAGVLVDAESLTLSEGSTVYDALMETDVTVSESGGFIDGIDNMFNGDCNDVSGWTFSVNDEVPLTLADETVLSDGDEIVWQYVLEW
jgi:hypothetical protein